MHISLIYCNDQCINGYNYKITGLFKSIEIFKLLNELS